jgi:hypothetical protein
MDEANGLGAIGQQKTWLHSAKRGPSPSLRVRRQRQCELVCAFGAPALFELINELDRHSNRGELLDIRLRRYAGLDPRLIRALGADRFPLAPQHIIVGGRR